ncbi:MAG: hypothetical protein IT292_12120 [Deltaproteobacteria bacterium]|nr:hypothetical protein [Deltaproteobacteria bacterium]
MNPVVQEVLTKSSPLALENWGMMLVEPCETTSESFSGLDNLFLTTMLFRGVMEGTIAIWQLQILPMPYVKT